MADGLFRAGAAQNDPSAWLNTQPEPTAPVDAVIGDGAPPVPPGPQQISRVAGHRPPAIPEPPVRSGQWGGTE